MFSEAQFYVADRSQRAVNDCGAPRHFRLVREISIGCVEFMDYYGPFDGWDPSWSIQMRFAPTYQRVAA